MHSVSSGAWLLVLSLHAQQHQIDFGCRYVSLPSLALIKSIHCAVKCRLHCIQVSGCSCIFMLSQLLTLATTCDVIVHHVYYCVIQKKEIQKACIISSTKPPSRFIYSFVHHSALNKSCDTNMRTSSTDPLPLSSVSTLPCDIKIRCRRINFLVLFAFFISQITT